LQDLEVRFQHPTDLRIVFFFKGVLRGTPPEFFELGGLEFDDFEGRAFHGDR
jgi:hypothetical protein